MITVDRCHCQQKRFAELLELVQKHGWDLEQLCQNTRCGKTCGLCLPYIKRALRTGESVFHEILREEPDNSSGDK